MTGTAGLTPTARWVGTGDYDAPEELEEGEVDGGLTCTRSGGCSTRC